MSERSVFFGMHFSSKGSPSGPFTITSDGKKEDTNKLLQTNCSQSLVIASNAVTNSLANSVVHCTELYNLTASVLTISISSRTVCTQVLDIRTEQTRITAHANDGLVHRLRVQSSAAEDISVTLCCGPLEITHTVSFRNICFNKKQIMKRRRRRRRRRRFNKLMNS